MATKGDGCVKRDVCTFYGCGSTSDLCADCGHYLAEAVKTPTNKARSAILQKLVERICEDAERAEIENNGELRPLDVSHWICLARSAKQQP